MKRYITLYNANLKKSFVIQVEMAVLASQEITTYLLTIFQMIILMHMRSIHAQLSIQSIS